MTVAFTIICGCDRKTNTNFSFEQIKDALVNCTSYDLQIVIDDDDEQAYALIDGCGDQDGDLFYDLDDVTDFICNNQQVEEYFAQLTVSTTHTKDKLDELVSQVNYDQEGFEDEDHILDAYLTKKDYDKLIDLNWTDEDFNIVYEEEDDTDPDVSTYAVISYYPCNQYSYEKVPQVLEQFFSELGIELDQACNG